MKTGSSYQPPPGIKDGSKGDVLIQENGTQFITLYNPSFTEGATRTVRDQLQEHVWVENFRNTGDTDCDVWEKAIAYCSATERTLCSGERIYNWDRTLIVSGFYRFKGYKTIIQKVGANGKVNATTPYDLSYPTPTNPGPMNGAAFYFTGLQYYPRIEDIEFIDFKFCLAYYDSHNSPLFLNVKFNYSQCGVFCYTASQNYQYINCDAIRTGVMHLSSATCYPADHPLRGLDSSYTDGLTIKNTTSHSAFACRIDDDFDNWFSHSIARWDTPSFSTDSNLVYPYTDDSVYRKITGRVVTVPMRASTRNLYGPYFANLDAVGDCKRGIALLNSGVVNFVIDGRMATEGVHPVETGSAYFNLGTVLNGVVASPFQIFDGPSNLLSFSNRGNGASFQNIGFSSANLFTGDQHVDFRRKVDGNGKICLLGSIGRGQGDSFDFSIVADRKSNLNLTELFTSLPYATICIGDYLNTDIALKDLVIYPRGETGIRILPGEDCAKFQDKRAVIIFDRVATTPRKLKHWYQVEEDQNTFVLPDTFDLVGVTDEMIDLEDGGKVVDPDLWTRAAGTITYASAKPDSPIRIVIDVVPTLEYRIGNNATERIFDETFDETFE